MRDSEEWTNNKLHDFFKFQCWGHAVPALKTHNLHSLIHLTTEKHSFLRCVIKQRRVFTGSDIWKCSCAREVVSSTKSCLFSSQHYVRANIDSHFMQILGFVCADREAWRGNVVEDIILMLFHNFEKRWILFDNNSSSHKDGFIKT